MSDTATTRGLLKEFRSRFWQPPRAHGEIIEDRTVSFLELFYDLVYVVVIARAAHTLAEHLTWRGVGEFAVVFGLIWLAWLNGTNYYELHGREDGRTRVFVFIQMLILALLAVFTADATGESGREFALVYALFMAVLSWLWYTVQRTDPPDMRPVTSRYLAGMLTMVVVVAATAGVDPGWRTLIWGAMVLLSIAGAFMLDRIWQLNERTGMVVTESMVERFGLFVIIVLGEVIVGVVTGLSEVDHGTRSIATGLVGLMIGFGIWWTYFDYVGRRLPRIDGGRLMIWMVGHLPVTMAIAASGAAIVTLVEHAADARAPAAAAWVLAASVAVALIGLIAVMHTLQDAVRLPALYRPVSVGMLLAAGASLLVGWSRPAPWLLAIVLVFLLSAVWITAVASWLRLPDTERARPD